MILPTIRRISATLAALLITTVLAATPSHAASTDDGARAQRHQVLTKVRTGFRSKHQLRAMSKRARAASLGRCVPIAEMTYCIGFGWNGHPDYALIAADRSGAGSTGDMSGAQWVQSRMAMTDAQRKAADVREIAEAMNNVGKARRIQ